MCYDEILVRSAICFYTFFLLKITFVEAVCNKFNRSLSHFLKFLLHKRRNGDHGRSLVQDHLLHFFVPSYSAAGHGKMFEIEDFCPGISEICNPRKSNRFCQLHANKMHGLRRTGAYDQVYGMFRQVFLQKFDRGSDPHASRIRSEKITPYPHGSLL